MSTGRGLLRKCIDHRFYDCYSTRTEKCKNSGLLEIPEGKMEYCSMNNGMRLISEYKKESFITTIGCFLPAGAVFEKPEERGSALFLEHVLFQATTQKNQQQIETELQEIGGTLTAKAMRDMFVFYGTVPSYNARKLADILLDVALNGVTCFNDVESAKYRILQELSKVESNTEHVVMDYFSNIAYQDTVLSKSVFPESCIIENFEKECLISFRKRVFKPHFMTMISSGAISLTELQTVVDEYITESSQETQSSTDDCKLKSFSDLKQLRFSGADLRLRDDNKKLGYVAIGFEGPTYSQCTDRCAFQVAKEIIGSWDMTYSGANHNAPYLAHSAFNTGLCHLYKSFILDYACNSIWGCYFVCDKLELDTMVSMLLREWRKLYTTVTNLEVERAINKCKFQELKKLNDPVDRFFDIVNCLHLRKCYIPMEERLAKYEAITTNMMRDAASKYICNQSPAIVGLGRIENLTDYCIILRGTWSLYY
ncbi:mitochondrial-processing peptidase subunit beta-like isoform X2 [Linepithema humile]|uniref:mitochondrial-processing peptidase subunit beta-like isoform X2 n=1 Tax=Linepithema humile TaxID=83485 RepID=UPI00351F1F30